MTTINWSDLTQAVKEGSDEIPDGTYTLRVDKATPGQSKSSGGNQITVDMVVEGGPYAGTKAPLWLTFDASKPKGVVLTRNRLAIFGLPMDELVVQNASLEEIASRLIGRRVEATVKSGDYEGSKRPKVDRVLKALPPATGPEVGPVANGLPRGPMGEALVGQRSYGSEPPSMPPF